MRIVHGLSVVILMGFLSACSMFFSRTQMDEKQYQYHAYVLAIIDLCRDAGYFSRDGASMATSDFIRGASYTFNYNTNALLDLANRTKPYYSANDERCEQVAGIAKRNGEFAESYSNSLQQFNNQSPSRNYYNTNCFTTGQFTRCSTY